ncbi:hypothetical protein [Siccirubricoccus sp. G192]|uniref:hypothetical protein n=1 Tax=Siccirubricoccus sp. G192 TaxID=2849651 RepID=UPI001C2BD5A2|nr:hypothetical protein [Siccirubricoccus sp. G192]MBV1797833.1 hypothetical protein [Siccirubricoccus sp. G192]
MRRMLSLAALLPVLACSAVPPYASLPADAVVGAGDPTRAAIIGSAYAFSAPESVAGRPDAAARAAAQVEYLATEIPSGPRWYAFNPSITAELAAARDGLRTALGISPSAPPQAVVDGLYAASRALRAGDQAGAGQALQAPVFRDGQATLLRLASLPPLPRTRIATSLTNQEMTRVDNDGRFADGGDGGKD